MNTDDGPRTRTRLPPDGPPGSGAQRRPRPLRSLLTILTVVALLIIAIAIANRGFGSDDSSDPSSGKKSGATAPSGERPAGTGSDGIATGFPHTAQGAQSAAANYAVILNSDGMFRTDRRQEIVDAVTDPAARSRLRATLDKSYSGDLPAKVGLNDDGSAPAGFTFVSRAVPVGTKTEEVSGDRATVAVWSSELFGLAGQGSTTPVSETWFTLTLKLHWTGGDWKVESYTQQDGPAPVSGGTPASGAEEIAKAVEGFGGFTYAR